VVYQVYLRSFADGNGDGFGDLAGLRSRLEYLADLGVDAVWINPWYRSPFRDGGYDVADYREIDPRFGSLAEAESLIAEAHDHGIRVLADLVPNHTSSEHRWFREALASTPGSDERDRYIFRRGKGLDSDRPPSDWTAVFGGPAWERLSDGDWYLHLFDASQPDLNWDHPEVRSEFEGILRFWLDRGIDGFRVDVAHGLVKDKTFPDLGETRLTVATTKPANHPHWDRDGLHDIVREWRAVVDSYGGDRVLVAEAWVSSDRLPLYIRPDEYHQCFDFNFLHATWDATVLQPMIDDAVRSADQTGSSRTWVLSNHDVVRHRTRYGLPNDIDASRWLLQGPHDQLDEVRGARRARAAIMLLLALPGSAYLYQGEELGLPEVWDLPTEVLEDPVWPMSGHTRKGRDGCRVPLPWAAKDRDMGFGGPPWLPQPEQFRRYAVDAEAEDDSSMLLLYRRAISLRSRYFTSDERLEWMDLGPDVLGFRRGSGVSCVVNTGPSAVALPEGRPILVSHDATNGRLVEDAAVWLAP
jgi:alpha-glucosidase